MKQSLLTSTQIFEKAGIEGIKKDKRCELSSKKISRAYFKALKLGHEIHENQLFLSTFHRRISSDI